MNLLTLDSIRHLWLVEGARDGENSDTNDAPALSFRFGVRLPSVKRVERFRP